MNKKLPFCIAAGRKSVVRLRIAEILHGSLVAVFAAEGGNMLRPTKRSQATLMYRANMRTASASELARSRFAKGKQKESVLNTTLTLFGERRIRSVECRSLRLIPYEFEIAISYKLFALISLTFFFDMI